MTAFVAGAVKVTYSITIYRFDVCLINLNRTGTAVALCFAEYL